MRARVLLRRHAGKYGWDSDAPRISAVTEIFDRGEFGHPLVEVMLDDEDIVLAMGSETFTIDQYGRAVIVGRKD